MKVASGIGQLARLFGQSSGMMTAAKMMTMFIVASVASGHEKESKLGGPQKAHFLLNAPVLRLWVL
jgi:hypothetical protein